MGNLRLVEFLCLLTALLEVPGVTSSSRVSSIADHYSPHEDLIPEETSYSFEPLFTPNHPHQVVDDYSPHKIHSQPQHQKGWSSHKPKTTEKPKDQPKIIPEVKPGYNCTEINNLNISRPEDVPRGYVLVNKDKEVADHFVVLNPPLNLTPLPPPQIKAGDLLSRQVETVFLERLSISFNDSLRAAGASLMTDSVFHTQNVTEDDFLLFPGNSPATQQVMTVETRIVSYGKLSAPLNGTENKKLFFKKGIEVAKKQRELGLTKSPLENFLATDLLLMGNLFQEIWQFESKTSGANEDEDSRLEMPIMVNRKEKKSIPEPDTSERTLLDAEFNFGLPASHVEFESFEPTLESWKEMRQKMTESGVNVVTPQDFSRNYRDMSEFYESLREFVMTRTKSLESFGSSSFQYPDELAQKSYEVDQFLVCRQGTKRNKPDCKMCILDPVTGSNMMTDSRGGSGSSMRRPTRSERRLSGGGR